MSYKLRGFGLSFAIHIAVLLVMALMSSRLIITEPLIIDFSLEDSASDRQPDRLSPPRGYVESVRKVAQPVAATPSVAEEQTPQRRVEQPASATSDTSPEVQAPVAYSRPASAAQQTAVSSQAASAPAKSDGRISSSQGEGNKVEGLKQSYLKEHFTYIRNLVQKKLSYPAVARKMGWVGKVIISFVVCTDGHAREIMIKEGSGHEMLDKNAISAVEQASPFPRPPVEAQLIIPINYSLN